MSSFSLFVVKGWRTELAFAQRDILLDWLSGMGSNSYFKLSAWSSLLGLADICLYKDGILLGSLTAYNNKLDF